MRRHAKASTAGSNSGRDGGSGRTARGAFVCALVLLAFAGIGASSADAAVSAKGVTGFLSSISNPLNTPRGVAVNQGSGNVYVVDGANNRVIVLDPNGKFLRAFGADVVLSGPDQSNAIQILSVAGTSGNFTLQYQGATTPSLPATASAAEVQSALNVLGTISAGGGSVSVTGGPGNATASTPYRITFAGGPLAATNVSEIVATEAGLAGGTPTSSATVHTANPGLTGFEICVPANGDTCKAGANETFGGAMNSPQGIAINQTTGDVYVTDQGNRRVNQYDKNGNFIRTFGLGVVASGPDNIQGFSEVQSITVRAGGGTFKLSFGGISTASLAFNASAGEAEAALNALSSMTEAGGSVTVSGGPGNASGSSPYIVTFGGALGFPANPSQISLSLDESASLIPSNTPLTCSSPTAATTKNFQWLRNGSPIGGATEATYTTTAADNGAALQCQAFLLNANAGATQISNPRLIASPAPATTPPSSNSTIAAPTLVGTLTVGSNPAGAVKLQCVAGSSWSGEPGFTYQWYRNGVPLSGNGANTSEYTVQSADLASAAAFQCAVTGTNAGGAASRVSANRLTSPAPSPAAPSPTVSVAPISFVSTLKEGGSPPIEICTAANGDVCGFGGSGTSGGAFGSTIGYPAVAPAGSPNAGKVLVADPANLRVQEFTSAGLFVRAFGFDVTNGGETNFEVCEVSENCKAGITGSGSGQFATATPTRVAEDAAGNIYTVEPTTNFRVQKFTLLGNVVTPQGVFSEANLKGTATTSAPTDVAIDPATSDVLVNKAFVAGATPSCPIIGTASVAESRVVEVSSAGALEGTHGTCAGITTVSGLAVGSGNLYASSTFGGNRVYVLNTGQPVAPTAQITNVSGIDAHSATLNALISPNGPELPYGIETTYKVEYKRSSDASYSTLFNVEASAGNRTTTKAITVLVGGLQAGTSYDVRLVANKGFGSGSAAQVVSFETKASAPEVSLPSFVTLNETEARLSGSVLPNGQATGYHFEYTTEESFEANGFSGATHVPASDVGVGSGTASVAAAQALSGLTPGATYHYRLVAANPSGQAAASGEFTTQDLGACSNAGLRSGQTSTINPSGTTYLPDCMAMEMVSPPQKFNQKADSPNFSPSGNAIQFNSLAALAETPQVGNGLSGDPYVATRTASNWVTRATEPPANYQFAFPCTYSMDFSRWTSLLTPEAETIAPAVGGSGGSFSPLGPVLAKRASNGFANCEGASADASHLFFSVSGPGLLAGDPETSTSGGNLIPNQYEAFLDGNGVPITELITRDKDGKVWGRSCGALIGGNGGNQLGEAKQGSISPDASRVYFSTRPSQGAGTCNTTLNKQRVMKWIRTPAGPVISEIGASECTRVSPPCDPSNGDDNFRAANAEGDKVFFTTTRQLVNSDLDTGTECKTASASPSAGCDLYLYEDSASVGSRLTQISAGDATDPTPGKGAEVLGVTDVSGDGSHAYFVARGVLTTTPNAQGGTAEAGKANLYLYERDAAHSGGRTVFIAVLGSSDSSTWSGGAGRNLAAAVPDFGSDPEDPSRGGDGHVLVFATTARLTPDDTDTSMDIYRYDSDTGSLQRISVAAPGGSDNGSFAAESLGYALSGAFRFPMPPQEGTTSRTVSEDGRTIVFWTQEALDPSDTDGERTAYVWRDGSVTAIQGSLAPGDRAFRPTVSMSGDEVAFVSSDRLMPEDGDNARDVYVLRSGGGYPPVAPHVPCAGEACQGQPSAQPGDQSAASESFAGPGNPSTSSIQCKKGLVRRNGKCIKKPARHRKSGHKKAHERHANTNRRDGK